MSNLTRRGFLVASAASTAACGGLNAPTASDIDRDVAASRALLFQSVPGVESLAARAAGYLIVPRILEGGFMVAGAYGEGALLVGDATVDYMSMSAASIGLQLGAQTYSQALFFMTPEALRGFRVADGWELGVDAETAMMEEGINFGASTATVSQPVWSVVYGQRGLLVSVSLEGAKYSRIIR